LGLKKTLLKDLNLLLDHSLVMLTWLSVARNGALIGINPECSIPVAGVSSSMGNITDIIF
jgi:hypothetical protein